MSQADVQARVDAEDAGPRTFPVARVAVAKLGMYLHIYIYIYISISVHLEYHINDYIHIDGCIFTIYLYHAIH